MCIRDRAKEKPDHFAVRQYAKYRLAAGKTLKSILVSCGARLAPFDIEELREVTAYNELELDTLGCLLYTSEKGAAPPPDRHCPAPLSDFRLPPRSTDNLSLIHI